MSDEPVETQAFNEGCQARINGEALSRNPYDHDRAAKRSWKRGWEDADLNWAKEARWQVRILPLPV